MMRRVANTLAIATMAALTLPSVAQSLPFPSTRATPAVAQPSVILVASQKSEITIKDAFARASIGPAKNGAAYVTIHNATGGADRLIGAETDIAKRASLHTHLHENGIMKMRPVAAIDVPAGGMAKLKPGGDHVMLMGLVTPLKQGESFPLTLVFEKAGAIEIMVEIGPIGARSAGPGAHKN